jgi:hypothetical protein
MSEIISEGVVQISIARFKQLESAEDALLSDSMVQVFYGGYQTYVKVKERDVMNELARKLSKAESTIQQLEDVYHKTIQDKPTPKQSFFRRHFW